MTLEIETTPLPSADETGGFTAYELDGQKYIAHDGIQYVPVSDAYTLHLLAGKVEALCEKVDTLTAEQSNIATMLATVVETVGPTLDKLTDHPMLKMFLGGK